MLSMPLAEHNFLAFQSYCSNKTIRVCFHGTDKTVLDSITTYGMLDPTNEKYNVRNGNAYGPGVYVSPNYNYSKNYAKGCLLVVLALFGTSDASIDKAETLQCDHIVGGSDIVVLRSTSQSLPIFAISTNGRLKNNTVNLSDEEILKIIYRKRAEITFDCDILSMAETMGSESGVRADIVYNLLMRELYSGKKDMGVNEVREMLSELDFTEY